MTATMQFYHIYCMVLPHLNENSCNYDWLEERSSATFIPGATQCDFQSVLDHRHQANLRDQALLTILSCSSGDSSGWLKAIHQSSLGLAVPGPEFVASLCLWTGIPPLCVPFSNWLFWWSPAPMMENLLPWWLGWHALSKSHPGVLMEQLVSWWCAPLWLSCLP